MWYACGRVTGEEIRLRASLLAPTSPPSPQLRFATAGCNALAAASLLFGALSATVLMKPSLSCCHS